MVIQLSVVLLFTCCLVSSGQCNADLHYPSAVEDVSPELLDGVDPSVLLADQLALDHELSILEDLSLGGPDRLDPTVLERATNGSKMPHLTHAYECGRPAVSSSNGRMARIVGGEQSYPGEFPWTVSTCPLPV